MKVLISKHFDTVEIFNEFKLDIVNHQINVIVGPSGCGKTTLLHAMAGLIPFEGVIENQKSTTSYVFQEDRLFPYLTVLANLQMICQDDLQINELLTLFEVAHLTRHYPKQLSGGERQRISIIRAFLNQSRLILMDEPFKSLDFDLKFKLIDEVLRIQKKLKNTLVLVTHDLDVAMYLGDVIHVLSKKVTKVLTTIDNDSQGLFEANEETRNQLKRGLTKGVI